jgi:hypothetical protein
VQGNYAAAYNEHIFMFVRVTFTAALFSGWLSVDTYLANRNGEVARLRIWYVVWRRIWRGL